MSEVPTTKQFPELLNSGSILSAGRDLIDSVESYYRNDAYNENTAVRTYAECIPQIDVNHVQAPVEVQVANLEHVIAELIDPTKLPTVTKADFLRSSALLLQYASQNERLQTVEMPYEDVLTLKSTFVDKSQDTSVGLDLKEQLLIALEQKNGDLLNALWLLFITSRQYARWEDSEAIEGLPDMDHDQIVQEMLEFYTAIAPMSPAHDTELYHDSAGGTYYAWTHALGLVLCQSVPSKTLRNWTSSIFRGGTELMRDFFYPPEHEGKLIPSDHTRAAEYGNAIGALCVRSILQ